MLDVLFVGLGSIGQRHLQNLKTIMGEEVNLSAFRSINHNLVIQNGNCKQVDSIENSYNIKCYDNLTEALQQHPDIVFITNPSSKHVETALLASDFGCHLFIEKPLGDSLDNVDELHKKIIDNKLIVMVGLQTRFHPCYKSVKEILNNKEYGDIVSANFEWGTYLPNHHLYEDYRNSYASKKDLGGGVVLGLIHEIDLINSFWGSPETVYAIKSKNSSLGIETEDTVSVLMGFKEKSKVFPVGLFLSYSHIKEIRQFRIQLSKSTLFCDLLHNTVILYDKNNNMVINENYSFFSRNELFLSEIKELLGAIKQNRQPCVNFNDGLESLKIALKIKDIING